MTDKVVGYLWASSYPLVPAPDAVATCRAVMEIVKIRALFNEVPTWDNSVHRALHDFDIPQSEWERFLATLPRIDERTVA